MKKAEQIICLLWIALAIGVCSGSFNLKLGTVSEPGPGFLPFGAAALLGIFAAIHLVNLTLKPASQEKMELPWVHTRWEKGLYIVIALLAYTLFLPGLGYLLDTLLLMLFLFTILERKKWWVVLAYSLLVIVVSYLVFAVWLMVQFPRGFLGIG